MNLFKFTFTVIFNYFGVGEIYVGYMNSENCPRPRPQRFVIGLGLLLEDLSSALPLVLKVCHHLTSLVHCTYYCFLGLQSFPGWLLSRKVVYRMVVFPDRTFPGKTIPGWSLSRKDVSRVVIFPDETISYD